MTFQVFKFNTAFFSGESVYCRFFAVCVCVDVGLNVLVFRNRDKKYNIN